MYKWMMCVVMLGLICVTAFAQEGPIEGIPTAEVTNVREWEDGTVVLSVDANHSGWKVYATDLQYGFSSFPLVISDIQLTNEPQVIFEMEDGKEDADIPLVITAYGPTGETVSYEDLRIITREEDIPELDLGVPADEYPSWMTPVMIQQEEDKKMAELVAQEEVNGPFPTVFLQVMTSEEAVAQAILANTSAMEQSILEISGPISNGSQDITSKVAHELCQYLAKHPECIDHREEIIRRSAYIFSLSRRHCSIADVFIIADESHHYIETHPGTAFGNNWERAMRVIGAESGFRYWIRYKGPRRSNASGLWQFLSSTAGWFAAEEMQRVRNAVSADDSGTAEERAGVLMNMLWATNQNLAFGLMNPVTASHNNNTTPTLSSNRTESFQRLMDANLATGLSQEDAFRLSQEQTIRYQLQMGARLLDQKPNGWWSQWEVVTVYGV